MDTINDINSLIKYLLYLIDFSDLIYSQNKITNNDYKNLQNEVKNFQQKINNSQFIPPLLKNELTKINLMNKKKDFSFKELLYTIFINFFVENYSSDENFEKQRRESILNYRNCLDNIYKILLVKS